MLWFFIFAIIICFIIITNKLLKFQNYWKSIGVTNHETWPFLGYLAPCFLEKKPIVEVIQNVYDKYPNSKYIGSNAFMKQVLFIRDIDVINKVTIKDFDYFVDRPKIFTPDDDSLVGKNVFALSGEKWRSMRSTISPVFTSSKMKTMFHLISECAEQFTDHFENQPEQLQSLEGKATYTRFTNDIIASVAFGIKCNSLKEPNNVFFRMGNEVIKLNILRATMVSLFPSIAKFFGILPIREDISNYFTNIVRESILQREKYKIIRPDLIHIMLETRNEQFNNDDKDINEDSAISKKVKAPKRINLSDLDIAAQAFAFFFAGFETVSSFLSVASYELAVNPIIQRKLQNEIDEVRQHGKGKVTYEEIMGMKYLDMITAETLRKWPPGVAIDRVCVKDYTINRDSSSEKPIIIKKGQIVTIPLMGIHNDPQHYPNPEKFDPERFNQENKSKINPRAYFPFGIGPRNCIGSRLALLESKLLLFHLLSKFSIVVVEKTVIPFVPGGSQLGLIPDDGLWLGFEKRK